MKNIQYKDIVSAVEKLCLDANYYLSDDIYCAFLSSAQKEESDIGKNILTQLIENADEAKSESVAMCQDTGMAVVFADVGQNVHIEGGLLYDAIQEGVRGGYKNGYLRNSVVKDPLVRTNTGDNTPAVVHFDYVAGDNLHITLCPKGFGSENMSRLKMLKPSDGIEGVKQFIIETVDLAGPNPCPPIVVGVGIGGTFEKSAILAKKSLLRPINKSSELEHIKALEEELLQKINNLGIGPAGLGGRTTALAVNIEVFPTHIAGLPVAVNISCHATRHAECII